MKSGELHKLLSRVKRIQYKISFAEFSKYGISQGQPRVLDFLVLHDGCIQKDISDKCDLEPATVTNILAVMEKAGLITRQSDTADRRIQHVWLTDTGRARQKQVEKVFVTLEDKCFEGFTTDDREQCMLFLQRMYENLKKAEEDSARG